jgi:nucleotide-binding universal stress UspA family protein
VTGAEATLTLAALIVVACLGRRAGRHLRWMRAQTRERAAWLAATDPAYRAELDLAAAAREAARAAQAERDAQLAEVARALRPVGTSVEALR